MTARVPDLDQARRFLTLLDEEATAFCSRPRRRRAKAFCPISSPG